MLEGSIRRKDMNVQYKKKNIKNTVQYGKDVIGNYEIKILKARVKNLTYQVEQGYKINKVYISMTSC